MFNKNIKIAFFDVDWTLLDHNDESIHQSTYETLDILKNKGVKLCISTSRSPQEMKNLPSKLLEYMDAIIMGAGTYIKINGELEVKYIEDKLLSKIIKFLEDNDITYRYCLESGMGFLNKEDSTIQKRFDRVYYFHPDTKKYEGEKVAMILYYCNPDIRLQIEELAKDTGNARIIVGGEIYPKNIDKGDAMIDVAKRFGYNAENIVAVGDGLNDISMIKKAGIGIAMGNGQNELKEVADFIADDVKNDGIYKAFKELEII